MIFVTIMLEKKTHFFEAFVINRNFFNELIRFQKDCKQIFNLDIESRMQTFGFDQFE